MKKIIAILSFLFLTAMPGFAQIDGFRAVLFGKYGTYTSSALAAQDALLMLCYSEHHSIKQDSKKIANFQRKFNKYLDDLGDVLTFCANVYGIYYQTDQLTHNITYLKNLTLHCPNNVAAVALSERKQGMYKEVFDQGLSLVNDLYEILPVKKSKNTKSTEYQKLTTEARIQRKLYDLNVKIVRLSRHIKYTTLLDTWYEYAGRRKRYKTRSIKEVIDDCTHRWSYSFSKAANTYRGN